MTSANISATAGKPTRQGRTFLFAIATVALWASAFPAIRVGLTAFSPFHVALIRYLVASSVLLVHAILTRMPLPRRADLPALALAGFGGFALYNSFLNWGEVTVPAATASFIVASAPIFMALFAMRFLREKLRVFGWVGIAISFLGVSVIAFSGGAGLRLEPGALLVLIAALAQSMYSVGQKPLLKRYTPVQFTSYAIWFGTLLLLVFTPGVIAELQLAPPDAVTTLLYLGVFPGAIGYITWASVLSQLPASTAASFLYMVPAFALVIAWVWLGEVPNAAAIIGGMLIICGVVIVNTLGRHGNRLNSQQGINKTAAST